MESKESAKENPAETDSGRMTLGGQPCPVCRKPTLTLSQIEEDIPFFGACFIFSMDCSSCSYHKADVEAADMHDPCKFTFEITSEKDMSIRVVKSSSATVKIPGIVTIESGPSSDGYVTNIEGMLQRVQSMLESMFEGAEDDDDREKAKQHIQKIVKARSGKEKLQIIIEDPTGNSSIISDRAVKSKIGK